MRLLDELDIKWAAATGDAKAVREALRRAESDFVDVRRTIQQSVGGWQFDPFESPRKESKHDRHNDGL